MAPFLICKCIGKKRGEWVNVSISNISKCYATILVTPTLHFCTWLNKLELLVVSIDHIRFVVWTFLPNGRAILLRHIVWNASTPWLCMVLPFSVYFHFEQYGNRWVLMPQWGATLNHQRFGETISIPGTRNWRSKKNLEALKSEP